MVVVGFVRELIPDCLMLSCVIPVWCTCSGGIYLSQTSYPFLWPIPRSECLPCDALDSRHHRSQIYVFLSNSYADSEADGKSGQQLQSNSVGTGTEDEDSEKIKRALDVEFINWMTCVRG